ncbi:pre-mRNA-splicing factor CWC22 homolog [Diachasmimorpha longicaudata]|uniref:pre-mRNA-splicing factor CWC22 homolog n=1 Tax=Diachasmimorpha longicaudata TaxID=58733 RepID=UPI0030B8A49D
MESRRRKSEKRKRRHSSPDSPVSSPPLTKKSVEHNRSPSPPKSPNAYDEFNVASRTFDPNHPRSASPARTTTPPIPNSPKESSDRDERELSRDSDDDPPLDRQDDRSRRSKKSSRHDRDTHRNRRRSRSRSRRERSRNRSRSRSRNRNRQIRDRRDNTSRRTPQEVRGRRYWDHSPRRPAHDSEEEHIIGDRFYGGAPKTRKDRDKENVSENKPHRGSHQDRNDHNNKNRSKNTEKSPEKEALGVIKPSEKRTVDLLTSKTGGAYIPPAKLRLMQAEITDKSGAAYQRIAWEALKKSIHGHINKVNTSNIGLITRELFRENIIRGRGLLTRSIIQAQAASPTFTSVYAALTAVINSKFPHIGELLLKRLVNQFKRGFKRNDKPLCISSGTFMAHLVNQSVAHEILVLQLLTMLVETPTDDSIEVAIAVLKECGMKLTELSKRGIEGVFATLRNTLHEGQLDKRVQYMIEVMFQVRKDGFKDHEAVPKELDLVEEDDQYTHLMTLDEPVDSEDILNVFKFDPEYIASEDKYKSIRKEILDDDSDEDEDEEEENDDDDSDDSDDEEEGEEGEESGKRKEGIIVDNTETNLTALRRTIYLTIQSSLDFEECAHKLMKMQLKPGQEIELCHMFLDCCAEMRTYEKFYGLLSGRFCAINKIYIVQFEQIFKDSYDTIHRLDMNKLRNVAKFFAHLLFTDSISWGVLSCIKLNEDDTTSSGRVFIKILFQELAEYMGLTKLNARVKDVTLQEAFEGLFPRENPRDTRFAINFFTSIGLGGLTDDLREHLKNRPKPAPPPAFVKEEKASSSEESSSSDTSSGSSSDSSDSSSSSSTSSSSSSSEEDKRKKKKTTRKESADKQRTKYHAGKEKKKDERKSKKKSRK